MGLVSEVRGFLKGSTDKTSRELIDESRNNREYPDVPKYIELGNIGNPTWIVRRVADNEDWDGRIELEHVESGETRVFDPNDPF